MSNNTIYLFVNCLAMTGWAMLFLSAFTSLRYHWLAGRVLPLALALIYSVLMISLMPFEGGGFDSLANLTRLFAQSEIALVGWIHYLAFDLFIGAWQLETAKRERLPLLVLLPSLTLTVFFGPAGLLFFLATRYSYSSKVVGSEQRSV